MDENNMMTCPFCMKTDFDAIGLKDHLLNGGCEIFNATITIEQERHLTNQSSGGANICKQCGKPMGNPIFCIWCTELGKPPAAQFRR